MYGGIIRYVFPIYYQKIAIVDPDYIKHVLVTHCSKYRKPDSAQRYTNTNTIIICCIIKPVKSTMVENILNIFNMTV